MAILLNKQYIRILKDKCYLKSTLNDGIFDLYCEYVIYNTKKDRDVEKQLQTEKLSFSTNIYNYINNYTVDEDTKTKLYDILKHVNQNEQPKIPEDLDVLDILDVCGYKDAWYTQNYDECHSNTSILLCTLNLKNNNSNIINYSYIYNQLKLRLYGDVIDV